MGKGSGGCDRKAITLQENSESVETISFTADSFASNEVASDIFIQNLPKDSDSLNIESEVAEDKFSKYDENGILTETAFNKLIAKKDFIFEEQLLSPKASYCPLRSMYQSNQSQIVLQLRLNVSANKTYVAVINAKSMGENSYSFVSNGFYGLNTALGENYHNKSMRIDKMPVKVKALYDEALNQLMTNTNNELLNEWRNNMDLEKKQLSINQELTSAANKIISKQFSADTPYYLQKIFKNNVEALKEVYGDDYEDVIKYKVSELIKRKIEVKENDISKLEKTINTYKENITELQDFNKNMNISAHLI